MPGSVPNAVTEIDSISASSARRGNSRPPPAEPCTRGRACLDPSMKRFTRGTTSDSAQWKTMRLGTWGSPAALRRPVMKATRSRDCSRSSVA